MEGHKRTCGELHKDIQRDILGYMDIFFGALSMFL